MHHIQLSCKYQVFARFRVFEYNSCSGVPGSEWKREEGEGVGAGVEGFKIFRKRHNNKMIKFSVFPWH